MVICFTFRISDGKPSKLCIRNGWTFFVNGGVKYFQFGIDGYLFIFCCGYLNQNVLLRKLLKGRFQSRIARISPHTES